MSEVREAIRRGGKVFVAVLILGLSFLIDPFLWLTYFSLEGVFGLLMMLLILAVEVVSVLGIALH